MPMASSTHKQQHHLSNLYGATAAPPPTPSAQPHHQLATSTAAADALSKLLHRLPPTLSFPTRRSSASTTSPPTISFSDPNWNDLLLSSASNLGFFQLTSHDISSQLAISAETESLSLFGLTRDQKESCFPKNWPLGFDGGDEEEDGETQGEWFCLDAACSTESTDVSLTFLPVFTRALEKLGLKILDTLAKAVGFENPIGDDPTRFCSLMWISQGLHGENKPSDGSYPYVIGLQYQIRCQQYSLLADSGWVSVLLQVDSIMVTLGDIAQVWSNGKLKKVRGRPAACLGEGNNCSRGVTMSLLVTLPMDNRVAPLLPKVSLGAENGIGDDDDDDQTQACGSNEGKREEKRLMFNSFSFEDYAWRVYHETLLFKDPLDRYRL